MTLEYPRCQRHEFLKTRMPWLVLRITYRTFFAQHWATLSLSLACSTLYWTSVSVLQLGLSAVASCRFWYMLFLADKGKILVLRIRSSGRGNYCGSIFPKSAFTISHDSQWNHRAIHNLSNCQVGFRCLLLPWLLTEVPCSGGILWFLVLGIKYCHIVVISNFSLDDTDVTNSNSP